VAIAGRVENFLIQKHLFVEQLQPDIVLFEDPGVLDYLHLVSNFIIHASHPTEASFPALCEYLSPIMNTRLHNIYNMVITLLRHFWIHHHRLHIQLVRI
jgi:hypothetical protein